MSWRYGCRRQAPILAARRGEVLKFIGSAVALWAVCATGIYLIGPAEQKLAVSADVAAGIPTATIAAGLAVYQP